VVSIPALWIGIVMLAIGGVVTLLGWDGIAKAGIYLAGPALLVTIVAIMIILLLPVRSAETIKDDGYLLSDYASSALADWRWRKPAAVRLFLAGTLVRILTASG
jgi:hypothetical protein